MGGTFDPIHHGHLVAASEVLFDLDMDLVVFMVASRPWQKSSFSDPEDRFLMTTLAASAHPRFAVSRMELDRQGPTYTVETLAMLRDFYGEDARLFFILGADACAKLGTWRQLAGLKELAEFVAVIRPGYDLTQFDVQPDWPRVRVVDIPPIGISSTDVRERVRSARPIDFLVPSEVARYIREHGLYFGTHERG